MLAYTLENTHTVLAAYICLIINGTNKRTSRMTREILKNTLKYWFIHSSF